ncbi:MAG: tol-pal system protein YbgF [Longimicrobiales bacterium]
MKARYLTLPAVALVLSACATKSDVQTLRRDMGAMQQRQDQAIQQLMQQNQQVLDTLRNAMDLQRDAAGMTSHRFQQLETSLARMEEIVGQTIQYITQLNAQLAQLATSGGPGMTPAPGATTGAEAGGAASAEEFYALGVQKLGEGAYATARAAFGQVIREFPNDPRAADAQYQIAESYYAEQQFSDALSALELVPRQWPSSARASGALYRAGVIAEEMGNRSRAREYYQDVMQRYPDSDEAGQARSRLREIS